MEQPIDFYIKAPSLARAIKYGEQWLQDVHDSAIKALSLDQPNSEEEWSERNNLITRTAKSSFLAQYASFIRKIDLYQAGVVEDIDQDIIDVLGVLSSSDKLRDELNKAIEAYLRQKVIGAVGILPYTCPGCQMKYHADDPQHANSIIALDPVRLFFKYLAVRIGKVNSRSFL